MMKNRLLQYIAFIFITSCNQINETPKIESNEITVLSNSDAGIAKLDTGKKLCNQYKFEEGIPYILQSIEEFSKTNNYQKLSNAYNILSRAYHDFGDYDKGIEYALLVIKNYEEHKDEVNKNSLWYAYNNLGINYDEKKQYDESIKHHTVALKYAINKSDSSYSFNNIGNSYKNKSEFNKAEFYFKRALDLSRYELDDSYHHATVNTNLLDVMRINNKYIEANKILDTAYLFALKSGSPEKLLDFYHYAYRLKELSDEHKKANEYLSKYIALKDSLLTKEKAKIIYDYQIKYETEKKEKEIAKNKLLTEQKNNWLIIMSALMVVGILIFINYRSKVKLQTENRIHKQRLEIARDLHDSLGAQLTFMNMILDKLKISTRTFDSTIVNKVDELRAFTDNLILELKNNLWALNSNEIKLDELKGKILNFIKTASESNEELKFDFKYDVSENILLSSKYAVNLFRIIQEIINNALKHSQSNEITIHICNIRRKIIIKIEDYGKGFDYENEKNKSYGLRSIESRVLELNGTVVINSAVNTGTSYRIEVQA